VFIQDNQGVRESFERIYSMIKEIDFAVIKPIVQFSYGLHKSLFDQNHKITPNQKVLYGLEEESQIDL
jgi:L-cysteine desulfidase